jgi:4-methyl-5(b-hydroxyethyl)-thiazole monophosphate biosynthesis
VVVEHVKTHVQNLRTHFQFQHSEEEKKKKTQMALRHIRFFPQTLVTSTNFTPKLKINHNRFFFSPSHSSSSSSTVTAMASNARKVLIPIADGTEPMEAVITIDVIRRSGADVTVASAANNLSVKALHGVKIISDASVSDIANTAFDLIALPVCIYLYLISIIDITSLYF